MGAEESRMKHGRIDQWLYELDNMKREDFVMVSKTSITELIDRGLIIEKKYIQTYEKSVLERLLKKDLSVLNLSKFLLERLRERYSTVEDLYNAGKEEWKQISHIKDKRAEIIQAALDEYLQS